MYYNMGIIYGKYGEKYDKILLFISYIVSNKYK